MNDKWVDIREETAAICAKLGLDPADVAELQWRPMALLACVYRRDDLDSKYVDPETGDVAADWRMFKVRA